jgi:spermidine synthase
VSYPHVKTQDRDLFRPITYWSVFVCFFISGFCSLLYEVEWTRLAFAHFGIITPVLSLVVSVFMLGLGVGSACGGSLSVWAYNRFHISPLLLYAAAEITVAIGAFAVPSLFHVSEIVLLSSGAESSFTFLVLSAICIIASLLPWCLAMGATIPFMMSFGKGAGLFERNETFSFLYAANVVGAATGSITTALALIELLGLRGTYVLGAIGNLTIAVIAVIVVMAVGDRTLRYPETASESASTPSCTRRWVAAVLFVTGFSSLGMEVCWTRDFTFELQTTIYAFAAILATYLVSTFSGSVMYRSAFSASLGFPIERLVVWLFPLSLLPVILSDPRYDSSVPQTLLSIVPLCTLLGFLTPGLIDKFGHGDPTKAGRLYAINIAGSILGPLIAGYFLLPLFGLRWSIILLALPFVAIVFLVSRARQSRHIGAMSASVLVAAIAILFSRAYDDADLYPKPNEVHTDYGASAVAYGTGLSKQLLVNAIPVTALEDDTKVMAHLPMVLNGNARNVLDICFGMGTTFRSLSTWGAYTTAVDLSPSVLDSFGFFYSDAPKILSNPKNRIVADDGRRYLMRTTQRFDVITIDPPPPTEAAGSSLLYSVQFYEIAKRRLAPRGILAQWTPRTEPRITEAILLALKQSFPYVAIFKGNVGLHLLASDASFAIPSAKEFVRRMPPTAQRDLVEWEAGKTPEDAARLILSKQIAASSILGPASDVPVLSDNRPYNEYFFLRRSGLIK